jgi:hypothetical protein
MAPLGEDAHTPPVLQAPRSHGAAAGRASPNRVLQAPRLRSRRRESLASTVRPLALFHGPAGGFMRAHLDVFSWCICVVSSFFYIPPPTFFQIFTSRLKSQTLVSSGMYFFLELYVFFIFFLQREIFFLHLE